MNPCNRKVLACRLPSYRLHTDYLTRPGDFFCAVGRRGRFVTAREATGEPSVAVLPRARVLRTRRGHVVSMELSFNQYTIMCHCARLYNSKRFMNQSSYNRVMHDRLQWVPPPTFSALKVPLVYLDLTLVFSYSFYCSSTTLRSFLSNVKVH